MTGMAFEVTLDGPYAESLERVIEALKEEGFGVLSRIDVHDAFKEKLDVEFHSGVGRRPLIEGISLDTGEINGVNK